MSQTDEYVSMRVAGRILRRRGLVVPDRTVRRWCAPGGALADGIVRTPVGKRDRVMVKVSTLHALLAASGLAIAA